MTCRELIEFLGDFIEGALPAAQHERFAAHLAECPDCVAYLRSFRTAIELARACAPVDDRPDPPDQVPEALVAAIVKARGRSS